MEVPPQVLSVVQPQQQGKSVRTSPRMQSPYRRQAGGTAAPAFPEAKPGMPDGATFTAFPEARLSKPDGGTAPTVVESKVHIATIARGYHELARGVD